VFAYPDGRDGRGNYRHAKRRRARARPPLQNGRSSARAAADQDRPETHNAAPAEYDR
jgi:hypothetical protein